MIDSNVRLKLSPPWITYVNMVTALFDGDPQIAINYNNENTTLVIATNNGDKATALRRVLPEEKIFGKVKLTIDIDGRFSNRAFVSNEELMTILFERNPALSFVKTIEGIITNFTYVVFKNVVVQFFNDNLNDIHGVISTLYQNIAEELFAEANLIGVVYNTDIERKVGMPLGEWP